MGAASASGELVEIGNSALFSTSTQSLSDTPSSAGDLRDWTVSFWVYLNSQTDYQMIFSTETGGKFGAFQFAYINNFSFLSHNSTGANHTFQVPNIAFRDIGYYHFVIRCSSTSGDGTVEYDSMNVSIWVNGEAQAVTSNLYNSPTGGPRMFSGGVQRIGAAAGTTPNYYVAEIVYLDGQKQTADAFGQYDSTDTFWTPKSPDVIKELTFGTNGFYFDNATNPQTDASGNGNNYTNNNSVVTSTHTPTNLTALLNPRSSGSYALSVGNLKFTGILANWSDAPATFLIPDGIGKWYCEFDCVYNATNFAVGICAPLNKSLSQKGNGDGVYNSGDGLQDQAFVYGQTALVYNNGSSFSYGTTYGAGDRINIAYDAVNGNLFFGKNGTWQNSATVDEIEAGTGTNAAASGQTGEKLFVTQIASTGVAIARFSDDDFVDTPPTGFLALTSTNLHAVRPTTGKVEDMFQQTLAQEGSLISSVATARSGWSNYVDILKNRSSSEGWIYRFSHDSSNEYLFGTNADTTYQSTSTLSGTDNWVGYSIRIGSGYNTAGGSQAHTTGSATTVTHNLGNGINSSIKLFNRTTGAVYVYHVGNASGKLWVLTTNAVEASSTIITNVTANAFDIGSGASSATYDYLVMQDGGFISIGKGKSNGLGDSDHNGSYFPTGNVGLAKYNLFLTKEVATNIYVYDTSGISSNPIRSYMSHNLTDAELTQAESLDFGINGFKQTNSGWGTYTYLFEVIGPSTIDDSGRVLTGR